MNTLARMSKIIIIPLTVMSCSLEPPPPESQATTPSRLQIPPEQPTHPGSTTTASVYSDTFQGKPSASGTPFDQSKATAASKTLPLGSRAIVRNPKTGKRTTVTITDRGPHVKGRGIDLSKKAARDIGLPTTGVSTVEVVPVE